MKQVYQADWDKVMEKYHFDPRNEELLLNTSRHGFWGKAFTTDPISLSNVMVVVLLFEMKKPASQQEYSKRQRWGWLVRAYRLRQSKIN